MAYARKSRAAPRRTRVAAKRGPAGRVRGARTATVRRTARPSRAVSKRPQAVRLVIEHQTNNPVQRPEMTGLIASRNTKKAKF
jgi:hypothetical protein